MNTFEDFRINLNKNEDLWTLMNVQERSRSHVNMKEYAWICKNMQERANFIVVNVRGSR